MKPRRKMYGTSLDNPMVTPPLECRCDLAIEVDATFKVKDAEVSGGAVRQLDSGSFACKPFGGTAAQIGLARMEMFGQAMPASGLQREDRPAMEVYLEDFELDPKTFAFSCPLCVPVKA